MFIGFNIVIALNFPTSSPGSEIPGWIFMWYFNKILFDTNIATTDWMVKTADSSITRDLTDNSTHIATTAWVKSYCLPAIVNGTCNSTIKGGCSTGNVSWINNTSTCGTTAKWTCTGLNWGINSSTCNYTNAACSAPVNGTCNSTIKGGCSTGNVSWIDNTSTCGTTAKWTCTGLNWGINSSTCNYANATCCTPSSTNICSGWNIRKANDSCGNAWALVTTCTYWCWVYNWISECLDTTLLNRCLGVFGGKTDHMSRLSCPSWYTKEPGWWRIISKQYVWTVPIYSCLHDTNDLFDHMSSKDCEFEGYKNEVVQGYYFPSWMQTNIKGTYKQIFRCYLNQWGNDMDHMDTTNQTECDNAGYIKDLSYPSFTPYYWQ